MARLTEYTRYRPTKTPDDSGGGWTTIMGVEHELFGIVELYNNEVTMITKDVDVQVEDIIRMVEE